jgi:hypothetical protein
MSSLSAMTAPTFAFAACTAAPPVLPGGSAGAWLGLFFDNPAILCSIPTMENGSPAPRSPRRAPPGRRAGGRGGCTSMVRVRRGRARRLPPADCPKEQRMSGSYYRSLGEGRFESTVHAQGAWNPGSSTWRPWRDCSCRTCWTASPAPDLQLARVGFDILGMIPGGEFEVSTRVLRPGRTIELLEAELRAQGARRSLRGRGGWPAPTPPTSPPSRMPVCPGPTRRAPTTG